MNGLQDQSADYLAGVSREVKRGERSPATLEQYRFALDAVFLPWAADAGLEASQQVTADVLHDFEDHLRTKRNRKGKPLSRETVRTYVRAVRLFLRKAKAPIDGYKPHKQPKTDAWLDDVLSREEIDKLETAGLVERDQLIVRVLADCGLRVSELINLKRDDLEENTHDKRYVLRIRHGKGDKPRSVRIPPAVYRRLKHFAEHPRNEYIFCGKRRHNGQVEQLTRSGVDQLIRNLTQRVPELSGRRIYPHLLRHSLTTHLVKENVAPLKIKEQLGHASLAMVDRVYSHLKSDDLDDVIAALR